ncbi:hypothetical protein ACWGJT_20135 [Streptomyces xantholiticus]
MPATKSAEPDQVLAVNVARRWTDVENDRADEADVVLANWSPWVGRSTTVQHFDPDRIAVIIACRRGRTVAVYDVHPDDNGRRWHWTGEEPRRRVHFHGAPSSRYAAHLAAPAPTWKAGEGTPVKILSLDDLLQGDPPAPDSQAPRHAVVGQAVVTLNGTNNLTVSVPADYSVTVTTRAPHDRSS